MNLKKFVLKIVSAIILMTIKLEDFDHGNILIFRRWKTSRKYFDLWDFI